MSDEAKSDRPAWWPAQDAELERLKETIAELKGRLSATQAGAISTLSVHREDIDALSAGLHAEGQERDKLASRLRDLDERVDDVQEEAAGRAATNYDLLAKRLTELKERLDRIDRMANQAPGGYPVQRKVTEWAPGREGGPSVTWPTATVDWREDKYEPRPSCPELEEQGNMKMTETAKAVRHYDVDPTGVDAGIPSDGQAMRHLQPEQPVTEQAVAQEAERSQVATDAVDNLFFAVNNHGTCYLSPAQARALLELIGEELP